MPDRLRSERPAFVPVSRQTDLLPDSRQLRRRTLDERWQRDRCKSLERSRRTGPSRLVLSFLLKRIEWRTQGDGRVVFAADQVDLGLVELVQEVVEPAGADEFAKYGNRNLWRNLLRLCFSRGLREKTHERYTCATIAEALESPEEADRDDLREDGDVERVSEDSAKDLTAAGLEFAAVVDVRELLFEDDKGDAEVEECECDDDRVPVCNPPVRNFVVSELLERGRLTRWRRRGQC